ncbi:MAG: hypothetical protein V7752_15650 [Halopseudomonas sp.]
MKARTGTLEWLLIILLTFSGAVLGDEEADQTTRLKRLAGFDGRIVVLEADQKQGVWALTSSGQLYHCQIKEQDKRHRVICNDRDGRVIDGY